MSNISKGKSDLSPEQKRVLLAELLRSQGGESKTLPVTSGQHEIWLSEQMQAAKPLHNVARAISFKGHLNVPALETSINQIICRHEALRTTFKKVAGQPVQQIAPALSLELRVESLMQLPEAEREGEAMRRASEEARKPFDITREPLIRVRVLKLSESHHIMLLTVHHIIFDGWSLGIFLSELRALYEAYNAGTSPALRDLPIQSSDFAIWQRTRLRGEELDRLVSYWKRRLDGAPTMLEVRPDRPRPAIQTFSGARQSLPLTESLSNAMRALSNREGVTLFMTLMAAFNVLVYRYTGQRDILVGTPVANRNRREVEGLIGDFVNTVVIRTKLSDRLSFRQLLAQVRDVTLEAYDNQELPFGKLIEELRMERNPSHNALFQVVFVLLDASGTSIELPDLTASIADVDKGTTLLDLGFYITEQGSGLSAMINYNTDIYEASTISGMLEHFQCLLSAIASDPDHLISRLSLLPASHRRRLLSAFNDTRADYPSLACAHEMFESQALLRPDSVAVGSQGESVSYSQLNRRANQLANYLRSMGVGRETFVGICLDSSPEFILSMLATLKAGAAFIPLDPSYPKQRLSSMIDDSLMPVLISRELLEDRLPTSPSQLIFIDNDWPAITSYDADNPPPAATPDNLAYAIYTSGSTGKPKGVGVTHASLLNLATWHQRQFKVRASDRATQVAAVGFDACVWEIWPYLLAGASICIAPQSIRTSPAELQRWIISNEVTISFLPTPLAEAVIAVQWPKEAKLRLLLTGGDKLRRRPSSGLSFEVVNNYGPTECTVVTTSGEVGKMANDKEEPTIGKPIANMGVYVLDREMGLVPEGVAGELYIRGVGLARGYLRDAAMTAERFIPDPYSLERGARVYKSGDLVRYRSNGEIQFLGRADQQVKVRGSRIEPGEIEAALAQCPGIADSAVLASEDALGETRLTAYLVYAAGHAPSTAQLRAFLRERLPEYMVPSTFVALEALPLTPNGKLDREALASTKRPATDPPVARQEPQTNLEQVIAAIWKEVLRVEKVGLDENFFDLGGHSLAMVQVQDLIRERLSTEIRNNDMTVVQMFEYPTVRQMAEQFGHGSTDSTVVENAQGRIQKQRQAMNRYKQQMKAKGKRNG